MVAGFASEDAKFMLQAYDLKIPCVQKIGPALVLDYSLIIDLRANNAGIFIRPAVVRHRHDRRLDVRVRTRDSLLKIGRERGYATLTRQ